MRQLYGRISWSETILNGIDLMKERMAGMAGLLSIAEQSKDQLILLGKRFDVPSHDVEPA